MSIKPTLLPLHGLIVAIAVAALILSVLFGILSPSWRWHQAPLHSAIEAIGGLVAIAMGLALFQRTDAVGLKLYPVAGGFLAMGVLELFHAAAEPGDGFVFLRNLASLFGGLGFALVWLPPTPAKRLRSRSVLVWIVAAGAIAVGTWITLDPEHVPTMIRHDVFTPTAVAPQSFACMLFLAAAFRFASDYRRVGGVEHALFASLAILFALAEVMFIYSTLWDRRWWFWHGIRLSAYLLVLSAMLYGYRQMLVELRRSLAQVTEAEETAREHEQELRHAVEMRERMAQDLHDGSIQSLFALTLNLERCQRLARSEPDEAVRQLGRSIGGLKAVIRDLRESIIGGTPSSIEGRNLQTVLLSLAQTAEASGELECRAEIDQAAADLVTPEQATHMVFIVREALSNTMRHARARHERIVLQRGGEGVTLVIEDDGQGFEPGEVAGRGEGLRNMAARAGKLGARFAVDSHAGRGTRLTFDIPLEHAHA